MAAVVITKQCAYPKQKRRECGAYAMKAVLELFEEAPDKQPRDLLSTIGNFFFGFTFPARIVKVMKQYNLQASYKRAHKAKDKIAVLKEHLAKGEPVILLIGNMFTPKRKKQLFRRWYGLHWLVMLGFDDEKQEVYLYDSNVRLEKHEQVPIGNVALSYKDFLKQWRGIFLTSVLNYSYIPVMKD